MKKEDESLTDERVAAAYRKVSVETAPPELDRAVLREARDSVRQKFWSRFYAWRRPLAFATTLVLGVALVYDMQTLLRQTDDGLLTVPDIKGSAGGRSDATQSVPYTQDIDSNAKITPAPSASEDAAEAGTLKLPSRMERAGEISKTEPVSAGELTDENRIEQQGSRTNLKQQVAAPASALDSASRKQTAPPAREVSRSMPSAADSCSNEQVATAESWWRCIEELRAAGRVQAANAELQKLKSRFPDFERLE